MKTKKMYRADFGYRNDVKEFEVFKESESSVWYRTERGTEDRQLKITTTHHCFDSKEDALDKLNGVFLSRIKQAEYQLDAANRLHLTFKEKYQYKNK
jgi:hypothetical protein